MKTCTKCNEEKEFEFFAKRSKSPDGLNVWCKECFKEYDRTRYLNGDKERKNNNKIKIKRAARNHIWNHLISNPCVDCGESDPLVLEFDHRDDSGKLGNISAMQEHSIERIQAEIEKCDIRCANCHRRRTIKQLGLWRGKML